MSNDYDSSDEVKQLAELSAGAGRAGKKKIGPMDNAHVMDWAPLNLGHPIVSMKEVNLIDLGVQVFGLEEIKGSDLPIAMVVSWVKQSSCWERGC